MKNPCKPGTFRWHVFQFVLTHGTVTAKQVEAACRKHLTAVQRARARERHNKKDTKMGKSPRHIGDYMTHDCLSQLKRLGLLERVGKGVYRLAKSKPRLKIYKESA